MFVVSLWSFRLTLGDIFLRFFSSTRPFGMCMKVVLVKLDCLKFVYDVYNVETAFHSETCV